MLLEKLNKKLKWYHKWMLAVAHACLLLLMTFFWMNQNRTYGDEQALIKWSSVVKRLVFNYQSDKPDSTSLLFIDVSTDLALIPNDVTGLVPGKQVITDRHLLARVFEILSRYPDSYKYIVCDVSFEEPSADDTLLKPVIETLPKIIVAAHLNKEGQLLKPIFNVPYALADYTAVGGIFYKWKIMNADTLKSIPAVLYEQFSGHQLNYRYGVLIDNGHWAMNKLIVDFKIRASDLEGDHISYGYFPSLSDVDLFYQAPESVIEQNLINNMVKDRIVVIGAFNQRDTNSTVLGDMGGSLILLNVFYSLMQGKHLVKAAMVLFLFVSFFLFSYHFLFGLRWLSLFKPKKPFENVLANFYSKYLSELGYLLLISIVCYVIFGIHINILFLAGYCVLIKKIIGWIQKLIKTKKLSSLFS